VIPVRRDRGGESGPAGPSPRPTATWRRDARRTVPFGPLYRLNVISIHLPPLRTRRDDIPVLAEAFLARMAQERKWTSAPSARTRGGDHGLRLARNVRELPRERARRAPRRCRSPPRSSPPRLPARADGAAQRAASSASARPAIRRSTSSSARTSCSCSRARAATRARRRGARHRPLDRCIAKLGATRVTRELDHLEIRPVTSTLSVLVPATTKGATWSA